MIYNIVINNIIIKMNLIINSKKNKIQIFKILVIFKILKNNQQFYNKLNKVQKII